MFKIYYLALKQN